jgi:ubiquinone/menaquinone biosynthesis C-methylase UbiE
MFPYFDVLFEKLNQGNKTAQEAFGEYVHWGYWNDPAPKIISAKNFHQAAELMTQHVVSKAGIKDGYKVLDVGCGFGGTIKYLNQRHKNCQFVGVNIDPRQIALAKKEVTAKNNNSIEFIEADACQLPFSKSKFDVVLCVESIFHFSDRETFFKECQRVLRPEGILVVSDFVPVHLLNSFVNFAEHAFNLVGDMYGAMRLDVSLSKYRKIAQKTGFYVESIEDVTDNTLPTYRFMKQSFREHLTNKEKKFIRATTMTEYVAKLGLFKYLILSFKKGGIG